MPYPKGRQREKILCKGPCGRRIAQNAFRCLNPDQPDQHFRAFSPTCKRCENKAAIALIAGDIPDAPRLPVHRSTSNTELDRKAEEVWARKADPDYYLRDRTSHSVWADMEKMVLGGTVAYKTRGDYSENSQRVKHGG